MIGSDREFMQNRLFGVRQSQCHLAQFVQPGDIAIFKLLNGIGLGDQFFRFFYRLVHFLRRRFQTCDFSSKLRSIYHTVRPPITSTDGDKHPTAHYDLACSEVPVGVEDSESRWREPLQPLRRLTCRAAVRMSLWFRLVLLKFPPHFDHFKGIERNNIQRQSIRNQISQLRMLGSSPQITTCSTRRPAN